MLEAEIHILLTSLRYKRRMWGNRADGSFTVTNTRNQFSKTYAVARPKTD